MTYKELYTKYKNEAKKLNLEGKAIQILICEIAKFSTSEFYLNFDEEVESKLEDKIIDAISKYLYERKPIQYILGYTYFYGLKFFVNENVLIPRRETEELVEFAITEITKTNLKTFKILDIGTGSGAIAIALKKHLPDSDIVAIDISKEALDVAKENARYNNVKIKFLESDLFSNIEEKFDFIISNPPYIASKDDVDDLVLKNEPHLALFAPCSGLYFYMEILKASRKYLNDKNIIFFEIPEDKDTELINLVKIYYPHSEFKILKDMQAKSRILVIKNNWR